MQILSILVIFLSLFSHITAQLDSLRWLLDCNFEGQWVLMQHNSESSTMQNSVQNFLDGQQGIVLVSFSEMGTFSGQVQGVIIQILMPMYYDQKTIKLTIGLAQLYSEKNSRWEGATKATYELFQYTFSVQKGQVDLQVTADQNLIGLTFSDNLQIFVTFQQKYMSSITSLSFAVYALVVLKIVRRKGCVQETNIRHSTVCLIFSVIQAFLIAVTQLIMAMSSLFSKMSPQTFFLISGLANMIVCKQIVQFYGKLVFSKNKEIIKSWVISFLYLWFILTFRHIVVCLIINSLVLIPEIAFHCFKGQKIQKDFRFLIFVISTQLYFLYYKFYPFNIFRQSPSSLFGFCAGSLLIVQGAILTGQILIGSRFFIPSILLPVQHDYYKIVKSLLANKNNSDCYICLEEIVFSKDEKSKVKIMVTPCQHLFHQKCLESWMKVQMKCPIDRSQLTPF